MYKKKSVLLLSFLFTGAIILQAQNDLKNWNSLQLDLSVTKKMDIRLSHLRGYNISHNFNNDFNQTSARLDYDITKKISLAGGVTLGSLSATEGANRFFVRATHKIPFSILSWSNAIQAEVHSSAETRYRNRFIYITRLATKKRLEFLRLSPSVSYWLYYNIGGNAIQYYDREGDPAVMQTPDGFHRGRLYLTLNSKINKTFSISIYYMMQREFDLFAGEYRKMNIADPVTGTIVRPYNDYDVIGTTLSLDFNLYKKKSKKGSKDTNN